ncbi:MAG: ester cyclase [Actinomycetota bacterium]|nr:ester cyclase [Actinomycetota bacterium]
MSFVERNKRIVSDLIDRCINEHDTSIVQEFTTNPRVLEFQTRVLQSFPDLRVEESWRIAEDNKVVSWQHMRGTHLGPWIFAPVPTGRTIDTDVVVAFEFDDQGQIVDQWFCTNFVRMIEQLGGHVVVPSSDR